MLERKARQSEGPGLIDRVIASGCRRVAILGLHPGAGTRTVLVSLLRTVHERGWPVALTSAPRMALETDDAGQPDVTQIAVPEGAYVATAARPVEGTEAALEVVEGTKIETPIGEASIYRLSRGGEVGLYGPADPDGMKAVIERLGEVAGGLVLVDGGWERRAFAAPGVSDGVILVVGAGYSASAERSAAAARYVVETLRVPPCAEAARAAWQQTASKGAAALLDGRGQEVGVLPPGLEDPVPALRGADGTRVAALVLPHGLHDELMIPLVRSKVRCALVVRDATRIHVSPVYFKAWLKTQGTIQVVRSVRLIAVATNPVNASGPDADPVAFRDAVASALPDLSVHDVVVESDGRPPRRTWKFWE